MSHTHIHVGKAQTGSFYHYNSKTLRGETGAIDCNQRDVVNVGTNVALMSAGPVPVVRWCSW